MNTPRTEDQALRYVANLARTYGWAVSIFTLRDAAESVGVTTGFDERQRNLMRRAPLWHTGLPAIINDAGNDQLADIVHEVLGELIEDDKDDQ